MESRRRLATGGVWRLGLLVAPGVPLRVALPEDELELDDEVTLPPLAAPVLRVHASGLSQRWVESVQAGVSASGLATLGHDGEGAELEVSFADGNPGPTSVERGGPWRLLVHREDPVATYLGPFAVDRRHPLATGLAVEGAAWAAGGPADNPPGRPVVTTGDVVLLSDEERADGGHDLHLRLREGSSTLDRSPAWPVLWWNLLSWRQAELPGPARPVARLGEVAVLRLPAGVTSATARSKGWERELRPAAYEDEEGTATPGSRAGEIGLVRWLPPRTGEYDIEAGPHRFHFAVGALQRAESDLRGRVTMRRGRLALEPPPAARRPIGWAAAIGALGLWLAAASALSKPRRVLHASAAEGSTSPSRETSP
jgi:hypothetical protein